MAIGVAGGFNVAQKKYDYQSAYKVVVLPDFKEYNLGKTIYDVGDMEINLSSRVQ